MAVIKEVKGDRIRYMKIKEDKGQVLMRVMVTLFTIHFLCPGR